MKIFIIKIVQEKLLKQQQPQPFQQLPVIWDKTQTLPYNCINNPPPHPPSTYIPVTAGHHSPLHFFLSLPPGAVGHLLPAPPRSEVTCGIQDVPTPQSRVLDCPCAALPALGFRTGAPEEFHSCLPKGNQLSSAIRVLRLHVFSKIVN